jgi:hypothetical protein
MIMKLDIIERCIGQYTIFSYSYVEVYSCNKFEFLSYLLAFQ